MIGQTISRRTRALRVALVAGAFWTLALPVLAYAQQGQGPTGNQGQPVDNQGTQGNAGDGSGSSGGNVTGHECEQGVSTFNPHCVAPEVPFAAVYPVLGAATFGLALAYRARRRLTER